MQPDADPDDEPDWLPSRVTLIDRKAALVDVWAEVFADCPGFESAVADYFSRPADALVSPANSFGIMDGGLDLAIRARLGFTVQTRTQERIVADFHGELPVGSAIVVETGDARWPYMIAAPTMRIPEPVPHTFHAYVAFRAVLVAVENFNRAAGKKAIDSLVCCGLGTGIGGMSAVRCARQMRAAYESVRVPAMIPSFAGIHAFHQALRMM